MSQDSDMPISYRELDEQLEYNTSQLHELHAIRKADMLNMAFYSFLMVILFLGLVFLVLAFIFPQFASWMRPEIVDFSGVLAILITYIIVQLLRGFYAAWLRSSEIRLTIAEQEKAISTANYVLDHRED